MDAKQKPCKLLSFLVDGQCVDLTLVPRQVLFKCVTWSYSRAPGYKGQPRNSSAITQPRDHMSMASQNGRPKMISGALRGREDKISTDIRRSDQPETNRSGLIKGLGVKTGFKLAPVTCSLGGTWNQYSTGAAVPTPQRRKARKAHQEEQSENNNRIFTSA